MKRIQKIQKNKKNKQIPHINQSRTKNERLSKNQNQKKEAYCRDLRYGIWPWAVLCYVKLGYVVLLLVRRHGGGALLPPPKMRWKEIINEKRNCTNFKQ